MNSAKSPALLAPTILLNDKKQLTDLLLKSGASINEMNAVRKHMSSIKGGRLAQHALPSSCHSLIISDVINDDISTIASGPTVEDKTTYKDAYDILSKYHLLEVCPKSIMEYLKKGVAKLVEESPSKIDNSTNDIICSNKLLNILNYIRGMSYSDTPNYKFIYKQLKD